MSAQSHPPDVARRFIHWSNRGRDEIDQVSPLIRNRTRRLARVTALDRRSNNWGGRIDPPNTQILETRYFGGLSSPEMAEVLSVSLFTIGRELLVAQVLRHQ